MDTEQEKVLDEQKQEILEVVDEQNQELLDNVEQQNQELREDVEQQNQQLLDDVHNHMEGVRDHIEEHEDFVREHIEEHVTTHLSALNGVILDYEKHSRRRSWITTIVGGLLALTNTILIILIVRKPEWLNWIGTP